MYEVIVDNDNCGECVDIFPVKVYELQDEKSAFIHLK